jgi:hypothetical protein
MRTHNPLIAILLITVLFVLAGCGAGIKVSSGTPPPPVTGSFTNSSLNGSYAFLIRGSNSGFYSVAGTLLANGSGSITGGTIDVNSPGTSTLANNVAVTGTYTVQADGRTTATLNSSAGNFVIDFVLLSSQHGLAIRFNTTATGSGAIDQQQSTAFTTASFAGSFAFSLFGADRGGNFETTAGAFTTTNINNSDAIQLGVQDFNDNGALNINRVLSGAFSAPGTNGRGTATLTTDVATLNVVYYIVDSNHVIFIETDAAPVLAGNAFRQSATALTGSLVLQLFGSSGGHTFAAGAILNTDNVSNILTTSTEDSNVAGTVTQNLPLSGTFSALLNGRGTIAIPGNTQLASLVYYPTTGGILVLSVDGSLVATGTAFAQALTTPTIASVNGTFGFFLAGSNTAGAVDAVASLTADGKGHFTGNLDENSAGTLGSTVALTGTYTLASTGRGTGVLTGSNGSINIIFYAVDVFDFIFVEADTGQVATGIIQAPVPQD